MKTTRIIFAFLLFTITPFFGLAQACMEIGTNLHFFDAGVFKDMKLSSSAFYTRNATYQDDGNDWDSGLADVMLQDENGYSLELPFPHPETGIDQIVAFTIGGHNHNYQTGDYVLLYDGEGTFTFANWTAATVTSFTPGRIEFTIDAVDENGIHIEINSSTLGNHVRNIRIIEDIYESNYLTEPYLPGFEDKVSHFQSLRFMDWAFTNNHPITEWSDRITPTYHSQAKWDHGMAWEHMIELANYYGKNVWINVPHQASVAYIDSMAVLFRDQLDADLTIYLEYSNECWNWIFEQTHWLNNNPPFSNDFGTNYGYYSLQMLTIWENAFSGQESRLKTVLAGHDYFVIDAMDYIISQSQGHLVDMVSYPGYVALPDWAYDTLDLYGASTTGQMVMDMLNANIDTTIYWMDQFKTLVADAYDKEFVMYEGGQHITPSYFGQQAPYNPALYAAQTHPDMYTFYNEILAYYQDVLGVTLFMNFTLASEQDSPFGSWGLVQNYFTEAPYPVKWNAIIDWINGCGVLAVETKEFIAIPKDQTIELKWTTFLEENNMGFEIQRGITNLEFEKIGFVKGAGNTSDITNYVFIDKTAQAGQTYYYRYKQKNIDGRYSYSPVISARIKGSPTFVTVFPNPAHESIQLDWQQKDYVQKIRISDVAGRIVYQKLLDKKETSLKLDVTGLTPGVYQIQMVGQKGYYNERLVVSR